MFSSMMWSKEWRGDRVRDAIVYEQHVMWEAHKTHSVCSLFWKMSRLTRRVIRYPSRSQEVLMGCVSSRIHPSVMYAIYILCCGACSGQQNSTAPIAPATGTDAQTSSAQVVPAQPPAAQTTPAQDLQAQSSSAPNAPSPQTGASTSTAPQTAAELSVCNRWRSCASGDDATEAGDGHRR
jgi:hypothetical protein